MELLTHCAEGEERLHTEEARSSAWVGEVEGGGGRGRGWRGGGEGGLGGKGGGRGRGKGGSLLRDELSS